MEKQDPIFVDGMRFEKPRQGAPEFIKGKISINVPKLQVWLAKHGDNTEWLNIDLKKSKEKGTLYLQLNTWKPEKSTEETIPTDDIPF